MKHVFTFLFFLLIWAELTNRLQAQTTNLLRDDSFSTAKKMVSAAAGRPQRLVANKPARVVISSPAQGARLAATSEIFNYSGSIVTYTVPANVYQITIEARGAEGGNSTASMYRPGKGAIITGTVAVTPGQQLKILVGQQPTSDGNGGGGGSFVTDINNNPLVIAGGGGGSGNTESALTKQGQTGTAGSNGINGGGSGGTNGNGGLANGSSSVQRGAGGGLLTNGADGELSGRGGKAFVNGGAGGTGTANGGFGGAGAGSSSVIGGAGGGYSGGGSAGSGDLGGAVGSGGGSYNAGTNPTSTAGASSGNGVVTFTYTPCTTYPMASLGSNGQLTCANKTVTLTAGGGDAGATYQYSPGATNNGATATVTNEGPYSVTVTNPSGCPATATTTVTSNTVAPQNVLLNNDGPLTCSKTSVNLTAGSSSPNVTYSFSGPGVTNSNGNTATVNQQGTYSVQVTGTNSCTATQTTQVQSNTTPPAATLSNNGPLSDNNQAVTLTAGGGGSYAFSQGAAPSGNGTATVTTPGIYQVTVTGTNGCTATASTTVTGGQNPTTICRNGTAVVNVVASGNPVRYEWYRNSTATVRMMDIPNFQRGTNTASLTLINQQTTANYYVRVVDQSGSSVVYGPIKVTVNTACNANARLSGEEVSLQITVLGNPLQSNQLRATVSGAAGNALTVQLTDMSGKPIRSQQWQQAESDQPIEWSMSGQASGVYLLQASTPMGRQIVKVLKP